MAAHLSESLITSASPAKSLFLGSLVEENIFPFPMIRASEQETLKMVLASIDKFMTEHEGLYRGFDRDGAQPQTYLDALKELGLFGLIIPEEFDGIGLSNAGYARVLQQTSRLDASTSLTIGAHSSIGMKGILLFGNAEQKKRYLPRLASGAHIAAFCLTEPGSGSDAASVTTNATQQSDGSWVLNGEKIWITNGAFAEIFTVFARTEGQAGRMTGFIVERGFGGVSSGPKEDKLGIRASATTTVQFDNVKVPAANVLGEVGKGFKVAMAILNNGRTGLGGGSVGAMKRCIELATRQASERKQFGKQIAEYPLIKEKIAQMTLNCFVTESVVNMVACYIDAGVEDFSIEAAMSKIIASEALWQTANEALQIAGGNGYMKDFPYERIVRDSRINLIFEGTNEILRLYIGLSGIKFADENLPDLRKLKEYAGRPGKFLDDPIKGFGLLYSFAGRQVAHRNPASRNRFTKVHPALRAEADSIERYTQQLGSVTEQTIIKYGKGIVGKQFPTKRLADIATDLFAGAAVLSRVSSMIESSSVEACSTEIAIAAIFTKQAKRRINYNLRRLEQNEDEKITELADAILRKGGYPWDVL